MSLAIFKPGEMLMQRLRMPAKFSLVTVAFVLPLAFVLWVAVSQKNDEINFANKERAGVSYDTQILKLVQAAQSWRSSIVLGLAGKETRSAVEASAGDIDQLIGKLESQIKTDEDPLELAKPIEALKVVWAKERVNRPLELLSAYDNAEKVIDSAIDLLTAATDNSGLTLDPDVDTYYTMYLATTVLPKTADFSARQRDIGGYLAIRKEYDAEQLMALHDAGARSDEYVKQIASSVDKVVKENPEAGKQLDVGYLPDVIKFTARFDEEFHYNQKPLALPDELLNAGDGVVTSLDAAILKALPALDDMLGTRALKLQAKRAAMLTISAAFIAVAGYLLWVFYTTSSGGFTAITNRVDKLGMGDLTPSWPAKGSDELSTAINTLRQSVQNLGNIVQGVRVGADDIATATEQISAGNQDLATRGAKMSATVQETNAAMQTLQQSVHRNMDSANQANQLVQSAFEVAAKGGTVVDKAVQSMSAITDSSKKIGDIIQVIDAIAFQTNILALNAAVEAARAGEQGRGFAVVASEVRNLAQRSASAAKEITDLIHGSISTINSGAGYVNQAGTTMREIVSSIQRVTDVMAEITQASNNQASDIQQIADAVRDVDGATQQNAALVEEISAAAASLQQRALDLSESVRTFKIDGKSV
jgi:methyl-accepting chemotaxis protein-1 (serine sensor receptor)